MPSITGADSNREMRAGTFLGTYFDTGVSGFDDAGPVAAGSGEAEPPFCANAAAAMTNRVIKTSK